jgi:hypothetical protein
MLLLWRNAFPRSSRELDSEKARGDAFTWRVSLEARAGAMVAVHSLLQHCPSCATDDVVRRLAVPVEACLALCASIAGDVVRSNPTELKALAAMLRLRMYEVVALLPPAAMENSYAQLLRILVRVTNTCLCRSDATV